MEGMERMPGGVLAEKTADAGGNYQTPPAAAAEAPRAATAENSVEGGEVGSAAPQPQQLQQAAAATARLEVGPGSIRMAMPMKKKRGRPRKYAPDGSVMLTLNPKPISASMPPGQYSAPAVISMKRGRGRPGGFFTKQSPRIELEAFGELVACAAGANFTPHVITIPSGEDVTMKLISFSQQGPRAICILSANGVLSNATLRQPDSSGGTLTYEGRFEILSLSGSFMPSEKGGTQCRSGGMSVSLASPDGRVVGGGVAGLLVAASPVQVVVGSFVPSYQLEQKSKKAKLETPAAMQSAHALPTSSVELKESTDNGRSQCQLFSSSPKATSLAPSSSFKGENWSATLHSSLPDTRNSTTTDINISLVDSS
ncbi:Putative DNA-binding protein ESCAROLA [Apostasia shenzhenica]|uniref:AT-hook motif nuclear-localized protein n=1 Tax=Apostasia shenzhenica TaxID=1088818 RepID=A0A2I0AWQ0_9ASPA|nr:Putative DNA-binding protein ESCAROLA [Apostasia shenzhenica]